MSPLTHALAFMSAVLFQSQNSREERGATAVEYGLLVALIAAVIVAVVALLGGNIRDAFAEVNSKLP
jgi:pilus assembly protein Flp/PilA